MLRELVVRGELNGEEHISPGFVPGYGQGNFYVYVCNADVCTAIALLAGDRVVEQFSGYCRLRWLTVDVLN